MDTRIPDGADFGTDFSLAQDRRLLEIFRKVPESLLSQWDDEVSDTGLSLGHRKVIAAHLYKAMADSHVLELRAWKYYWNVKGPVSHGLKAMLKEQACEQAALREVLGQRIRALSFEVPSSLLEYLELSELRERGQRLQSAELMLKDLAAGHALLVRELKAAAPALEAAGDLATLDVFTRHIGFHEGSMRLLLSCLRAEDQGPFKALSF